MNSVARTLVVGTLLAGIGIEARVAAAYNEPTHHAINQFAMGSASIGASPSFHDWLRGSAGLLRGILTSFTSPAGTYTPLGWIGLGGREEDAPFCRSARHFHDPLRPWDSAGLEADPVSATLIAAACGAFSFPSAVRWGQAPAQAIGRQATWREARQSYHRAVTGTAEPQRDVGWTDTLRSLGQVMHLVADSSNPDHVRNDAHILEGALHAIGGVGYGNYDYWVQFSPSVPFSGAPPFDRAILQLPTNDPQAPIPIARLIDTDRYTGAGSGAAVTLSPAIGIAEFANANFFSEDTGNRYGLGRHYPFPAIDLLAESQHPAPYGNNLRRYYKKGGDGGAPVDPVLAECVFDQAARAEGLPVPATYNCVDENVWQATASYMVPRAVDYTAGVLEYFFRGRLEIAPPARYAYGLAAYEPGNSGGFWKLRFKVRNATPGEEAESGQMTAVVQYRLPMDDESLIDNPYADISEQLFYAVSAPIERVALTSEFRELLFTFPSPLPTNAADLFLTVVYRGPLGLEADAVMVGGKDLYEPDPLDVGNASDWECFEGGLHNVADSTAYPPYSAPGQTQRDINRDGIEDLFGPMVMQQSFAKVFDLAQPVAVPSETTFDLQLSQVSFARYARVMLLQDRPSYGASVLTRDVRQASSGPVSTEDFRAVALTAVLNDVVLGPDGALVRRVRPSGPFRGVPLHHAILYVTRNTEPCIEQTRFLRPDLIRIEGALPLD